MRGEAYEKSTFNFWNFYRFSVDHSCQLSASVLAEHGKFESIFDSDGTASDKICSNAFGTKGERD